ncbi:MAG: glycosyltransferase family 4 protein [Candidatus Hydrogenedentes bacterium]|nr:glycosyltransferase family 4 protein [Candidatus Hydrogenedentota bacterium]
MKLRIALVSACPYPVPQGSQVFLRDNALALKARGHDVRLVVYGYGEGRDHSGLHIHRCHRIPGEGRTKAGPSLVKPLQDLALAKTLRDVVRRERIDAVIVHNYEALLVGLLAGKRPLIYHAHNAMSDELPYYFGGSRHAERLGRWLDRTFPRRADRVIVPHRRLAGHLIVRGCDHTKVSIIPPPVRVGDFEASVAREAIPPVIYTGNLDAYQNLGLLFAAMEQVRKRLPDARLQIATPDKAAYPDAEVVPIRGFDSLHRLLAQDSVLALPRVSWSGYPIKLLNAMAAGKAIVACQSAAYPLTDGVDGLVVPDDDVDAFAEALHRLLIDAKLRHTLGRAARTAAEQAHDPEAVGEQLENVVLNALEASQGQVDEGL